MKQQLLRICPLGLIPILLSGCGYIGEKTNSLSVIYAATAILSLILLGVYLLGVRQKDFWFILLFSSVLVVNTGYYLLSASQSLSAALWANRIAYLGSVFLPVAMLMIILRTCNMPAKLWLRYVLLGLGFLVLFVAGSPGWLDIYYREVSFQIVDGVGVLTKVYGAWHILYLFYLLGYFGSMVWVIVCAAAKDRIESTAYAVVLAIAVFVNIGVWLIEQLTKIDFEILSVSYIISELFLLGLNLVMAEAKQKQQSPVPAAPDAPAVQFSAEQLQLFRDGLGELTKTERLVYDAYLAGKSTRQIMEALTIKENTLKFHNKNLYSKLGVSSRKQLVQIARILPENEKTGAVSK